jgi:hypothetical protein
MASVTDTRVAELALSHEGLASQPEPVHRGQQPRAGRTTRSQRNRAFTSPRERRRWTPTVVPVNYAVPVSISDKTRKTLWAKAGGRCSICQQQLVTDAEAADDEPSVFGEECHIVARSPGGHHIRHKGHGGETSVSNCALLCRLCRRRHNWHYAELRVMPF